MRWLHSSFMWKLWNTKIRQTTSISKMCWPVLSQEDLTSPCLLDQRGGQPPRYKIPPPGKRWEHDKVRGLVRLSLHFKTPHWAFPACFCIDLCPQWNTILISSSLTDVVFTRPTCYQATHSLVHLWSDSPCSPSPCSCSHLQICLFLLSSFERHRTTCTTAALRRCCKSLIYNHYAIKINPGSTQGLLLCIAILK